MSFTKKEMLEIKKLNTPKKVQEFVDTLTYNVGERLSIIDVFRQKLADCLEAALFSMYCLRQAGYDAFIIDLSAIRDEDHVLCIYRLNGLYGSVAQSKFVGLRSRHPVYKNLRELAMSYFDNYFSYQGYFGLRSFSKMPLKALPNDWIEDVKWVKKIESDFSDIKHEPLVPPGIKLTPVTKLKFQREIVLFPHYAKIAKKYK